MERIDLRGETKTWCEKPGLLTWASEVLERWAETRQHIVQIDGYRTVEMVGADVLAAVEQAAMARLGVTPW